MDNPVMKSGKLLAEFVMFCAAHPEMRFWQALAEWSGWGIIASKECPVFQDQIDTIAWETKDGKA